MQFTLATIERRRLLLPLPFGVAKLQAAIFELVSKFPLRILSKPILTRDQVELLRYDNVVSDAARRDGLTLEGLGITPQSIAAISPTYLWRFRKAGQFRAHLPEGRPLRSPRLGPRGAKTACPHGVPL